MRCGSGSVRLNNTSEQKLKMRSLRILFWIVATAVLTVAISSCREEEKIDVAKGVDAKKMPTMSTINVATLISDSGITQYKVVSPLWNVYDNVDTPYWTFPKGLYLQKFDRNLKVIASVACDSAIYFKQKRTWRLDGNVELQSVPKQLFLTQQLFWDERQHRIYGDSFIHIENATHILEGYGFHATEDLRVYTIYKPSAVFPLDMKKIGGDAPASSSSPSGGAPTTPSVAPSSAAAPVASIPPTP